MIVLEVVQEKKNKILKEYLLVLPVDVLMVVDSSVVDQSFVDLVVDSFVDIVVNLVVS